MNSAATVFLNNEIGEKEIIELVKEYSIVNQLEEEDVQYKFSVSDLKAHLFSDEQLSFCWMIVFYTKMIRVLPAQE